MYCISLQVLCQYSTTKTGEFKGMTYGHVSHKDDNAIALCTRSQINDECRQGLGWGHGKTLLTVRIMGLRLSRLLPTVRF